VRFVERNTNAILGAIQGNINVKDRFRSVDFFLPLPPIPLPHAGRYEFQIWTNDVFLGSTFLDVEPRDNKIAKKEEA
jgi:hypothetical protein